MRPYYKHGGISIYNGDCRDIWSDVSFGVDLVLADPPYGIGWCGHPASTQSWDAIANDCGELDLRFLLNMQCRVVAFGANNYPTQLPHRGRWVCWDKRVLERADKMLGASFELAWTNCTVGFGKMYRIMHGGVVNANGGARLHPTEKPIELMRRIILDYGPAQHVLDPFMGSGTTLRAAKDMKRSAIGIEIEERYCEIAAKRLEQEIIPLEETA